VAFGGHVAWHNRNDANPAVYDDVFLYELASGRERRVTRGLVRARLGRRRRHPR
jgi:hypothetical protein